MMRFVLVTISYYSKRIGSSKRENFWAMMMAQINNK